MRIETLTGIVAAVVTLGTAAQTVQAQEASAVPRITLEEARTALDAAEAEARRNDWKLVFVISDAEGTPIYLRRMDGVPKRNYEIAMNKISTSITSGMHTVRWSPNGTQTCYSCANYEEGCTEWDESSASSDSFTEFVDAAAPTAAPFRGPPEMAFGFPIPISYPFYRVGIGLRIPDNA